MFLSLASLWQRFLMALCGVLLLLNPCFGLTVAELTPGSWTDGANVSFSVANGTIGAIKLSGIKASGTCANTAGSWNVSDSYDFTIADSAVNLTDSGFSASGTTQTVTNSVVNVTLTGTVVAHNKISIRYNVSRSWRVSATFCDETGTGTLSPIFTPSGAVASLSVTLNKVMGGVGTVAGNPIGVDCGTTCSALYPTSSSVTLTATPETGTTFVGWSGDCTGTGTCVVAMNGNHSVVASFAKPPTVGSRLWSYHAPSQLSSTPAVGNGALYVGSDDNRLYALDSATGSVKWSYLTGGAVGSPAIAGDGTIYVGSADYKLYALNSDGTLKWSYATGSTVGRPVIAGDGTIVVNSGKNSLYALLKDGSKKWLFSRPSGSFMSSPLIGSDGTTTYVIASGTLYALDSTGNTVWSAIVAGGGAVAIGSDGTLFVKRRSNNFMYLTAVSRGGVIQWDIEVDADSKSVFPDPVVDSYGIVYLVGNWTYDIFKTYTVTVIYGGVPLATAGWRWTCVTTAGAKYPECTASIGFPLAVSFTGTGGGSVSGDIACSSDHACLSILLPVNSTATLYATPDAISTFSGWSEDCAVKNGNCQVSMDTGKNIIATFKQADKARIGSSGYTSFADAYTAASEPSTTIMLLEDTLPISTILNKPLVLEGGYRADFSRTNNGYSTLQGIMTIGIGKVIMDRIVLK